MRRDVQEIFKATPHEKQCMMFSATLPKEIRPVCKKFMNNVILSLLHTLWLPAGVLTCLGVVVLAVTSCLCVCVLMMGLGVWFYLKKWLFDVLVLSEVPPCLSSSPSSPHSLSLCVCCCLVVSTTLCLPVHG